MTKPVTNWQQGLAKSLSVRQDTSDHDREVFGHCITACVWFHAKTYRELCEHLERHGVPTPNAAKSAKGWQPPMVERILKRHGVTAKALYARTQQVPWQEVPADWPQDVYRAWAEANAALSALSPRNGEWRSALTARPIRAMPARWADNEGQVVREARPGVFEVHWIDDSDLSNRSAEVRASDLEVYVWRSSLEERLAESQRLRERFFRKDNQASRTKR